MIAPYCSHESAKRHGKDRNGNQRYRCNVCGKTFVEETAKPLGNMRIDRNGRVGAAHDLGGQFNSLD